ncbi:hypothetical protein [Bacteroides sp. An322]|uniref:hypothetical protein n=1 Tax=Bacteroides sp. An322 TaxID=1965632 RepID=UPI00117C51BB|nr:hypothetical protein [Bacteroides sp. An322]
MISDLSSFVELFAAVYITMAVNNDFCSNFWTPQYYKEMESLLNQYNFPWSSSMSEKLNDTIKKNYNKVQKKARLKGTILLALCVFVLILMGFENETNCHDKSFYSPILYCILFTFIVIVLSKYILRSWRWVLGIIIIDGLILSIAQLYTNCYINNNLAINFMYDYKKYLLIFIIIYPIFHQMYIYWMFSSIYKGYLKHRVCIEFQKYTSSMEGIKNKQKEKVDKIYLDQWTDSMFSSAGGDITNTDFNNILFQQLLKSATPTHIDLLKSWIKFKIKQLYAKKIETNQIDSHDIFITNQESPLSQYKSPKLDLSKEYQDYCNWKKLPQNKRKGLKGYCIEKNIEIKDMNAWIRIYYKKEPSSTQSN